MSDGYTGVVVVVPTRNRADIAANAIRSALSQVGGGDLRVLVSDNSTSAEEAARLAAFCGRAGDARLHYVRPPEPLAMSPHWDWAARQALDLYGLSHVTFLTDRMIFKHGALGKLARIASSHPDEVVSYKHDRVDDDARPVRVHLHAWTGRLFRADSARLLRASAESALTEALPRMLNCLVPRATLELLRARFGAYFASIAPDFNFCYHLLAAEDAILYLDESLLVHYALGRSNGASASRGEMTRDRADFMAASRAHAYSAAPIPGILTVHNAILHEYCVAREETRSPKFPPVDVPKYLRAIAAELPQIVNPEVRRETERLLSEHGWVDAEAAARAQPLWRKVLSPRRVWDKLVREARGLYERVAPPALPAAAPGFQTVEEALDYAARHAGREQSAASSQPSADHRQREETRFGFVEVPADEVPRAAPPGEEPLPLGARARGGL